MPSKQHPRLKQRLHASPARARGFVKRGRPGLVAVAAFQTLAPGKNAFPFPCETFRFAFLFETFVEVSSPARAHRGRVALLHRVRTRRRCRARHVPYAPQQVNAPRARRRAGGVAFFKFLRQPCAVRTIIIRQPHPWWRVPEFVHGRDRGGQGEPLRARAQALRGRGDRVLQQFRLVQQVVHERAVLGFEFLLRLVRQKRGAVRSRRGAVLVVANQRFTRVARFFRTRFVLAALLPSADGWWCHFS
mmetsp:Transcript_4180/g.13951  ORF Transcript_4180/g.13951 Transcript_4180/m.13951 type:complete len:246 (+) Transcript_4180:74-811(+)